MALALAAAWMLAAAPFALGQPSRGEVGGGDDASALASTVPEGLTAGDWTSIRAAYEAGRHQVFAVDDGHHIGWDVIVADLIGDTRLDVICGGLGWAHPDDEAAGNAKKEVGRVYLFGGEQF